LSFDSFDEYARADMGTSRRAAVGVRCSATATQIIVGQ
jgi:hypothetical protein